MHIKIQPNYYQGTINAPSAKYATGEDGDILEFATTEAAQEYIDKATDYGTYYLSHGEADPPTYTIVEDDGDDDCYSGSGEMGNDMEEMAADEIPPDVLDELQRQNVEWSCSGYDYDVYTAWVFDRDGYDYAIVFCPKHTALQIAGDDLGIVNWENEAYYRREAH